MHTKYNNTDDFLNIYYYGKCIYEVTNTYIACKIFIINNNMIFIANYQEIHQRTLIFTKFTGNLKRDASLSVPS